MLRRSLFIAVFISVFLLSSVFGMSAIVLDDSAEIDITRLEAGLYKAASTAPSVTLPTPPENPSVFVQKLARVDTVNRVDGGAYWLYATLANSSAIGQWVFEVDNTIVDNIRVIFYNENGLRMVDTGYLSAHQYSLHYGVDFDLPKNQELKILVYIKSRYYSGSPSFKVSSKAQYKNKVVIENSIILSCLGAIFCLALYNIFIGGWTKDFSYLYYSVFLIFTVIAWAASSNALAEWFNLYSYYLLIPPFYLIITFNILYYIHFLELPKHNPKLAYISYGLAIWCFLLAFSLWFFSPGYYLLIHTITAFFWVMIGMLCGIVRWVNGYKPARFLIAAFAVFFMGCIISMLPIFGSTLWVKNNYIVTLVSQTIEILFLALALADRINIYHRQTEAALRQSYEVEQRAAMTEHQANITLRQALSLSEQEIQRKSDFLRMVSHELRTPLYSIISSVEQWDEDDEVKGNKDLLEYMSYGAARLRMQVDNLVLLAETDNKRLELANRPFEIRLLLEAVCENIKGLINPDVEFIFKCAELVPVSFKGDSYLLEHMLRTVLENACKYTEHGKICFLTEWHDETLGFHITDTGCGMTRDQERTMFNDFIQVSRGLERSSEGLGIGLTVCYRISEVMGADLNIKSSLGVGTIVDIQVQLEVLGGRGLTVYPERIDKAQVLIVEDNIVNAKILQSMVNLMGANGTIVESGQDALAILNEKNFHLVLMDIQMPVMDGITATRWIRRRNYFMPVVAVTANSDSGVRSRCVDVGMSDFLVKPIRRSDLQRVMERQLLLNNPPQR